MVKRKVIMAIADGIGDRPNAILGNQTPLAYAHTPTLDYVAAKGLTGIVDLISPGTPVGTDMGHLILFGYEPSDYPGRGPIEALGIDMTVKPGDVVFRCNFATVDENGIVLDRRAGRIREQTEELAKAINGMDVEDGIQAFFKQGTEHRAVLILRGEGLSDQVSHTDPLAPNDGMPYHLSHALDDTAKAKKTAKALNIFLKKAQDVLENHPVNLSRIKDGKFPANFILTRGAGLLSQFEPIGKEQGFTGSCIAGEGTVLGVAKLAGFHTISDKSMTGNIDTNIALKAKQALNEIQTHDIVYVHMKAPDLYGHDNEPFKKAQAIESFDKMVEQIMNDLPKDVYLVLAADHSTPCEVGEHSGEPVPVAIYGPSLRVDHIDKYNEIDCAQGGLGRLKGHEFVNTLHDLMGYSKKMGN